MTNKVLTLLMALSLVLSMGISAFAAEDYTELQPGTRAGDVDTYDTDGTAYDLAIAPRAGYISQDTLALDAGELVLVTENGNIVLPEARLEPNTEYAFEVWYAPTAITTWDVSTNTDAASQGLTRLTGDQLGDDAKPRVRASKGGSAIKSTDVKSKGVGTTQYWRVVIETKDTYNTKQTETNYKLTINGTADGTHADAAILNAMGEGDATFLVGHGIMKDEVINNYDEEDEIDISLDAPIFKKKQIEELVKVNNYKAITLIAEDDSWEYTGRMNGMGDTNFYFTQDVIPSIMNKFDQDFKFLIFPAGVTFPTNGEMRIDVSDVSDDWDRMYTYLYRNGKLTRINTSYDGNDDMITFRTNYLGAFVMTNVEITDTTIIEQPGEESSESPAPEPSPGTSGETGTGNPNTGLPVGLNLVVGLGSLSLLTAGSVILRKKK